MYNNIVGPKICSTKRALVREFDSVKITSLKDSNVHSIKDFYTLEYLILDIYTLEYLILAKEPGRVAQSVTCLATDTYLTADPGVASSITARSHTFMKIDHDIISTVILLPSAETFKKGGCQLQVKVCAQITG